MTLSDYSVQVWSSSLTCTDIDYQAVVNVLSTDELERANRFSQPAHRRRFAVARAVLRSILGKQLGVLPRDVIFSYGQHGKPSIIRRMNNSSLNFSIAHSGDRALYAVAIGHQVGVDIEQVRHGNFYEGIARRFFAEEENRVIFSLQGEERRQAFYRCWTRKEAFIKATGLGFSSPLTSFAVSVLANEKPELLRVEGDDTACSKWSLFDIASSAGYVSALAVAGSGWTYRCMEWEPYSQF